jgi:hypothetical protein
MACASMAECGQKRSAVAVSQADVSSNMPKYADAQAGPSLQKRRIFPEK